MLCENKLASLPHTVGLLGNLEELDLRNNSLATLPRHIAGMRRLKKMVLRMNLLKTLPPEIGTTVGMHCTALRSVVAYFMWFAWSFTTKPFYRYEVLYSNISIVTSRQLACHLLRIYTYIYIYIFIFLKKGIMKDLEYLDLDMNEECLLDENGVYGVLKRFGTQAAVRSFSSDITWTHYLHPVLGKEVNGTVLTLFLTAYRTEANGTLEALPVELWLKIIEMLTIRYLGFV